MFAKRISQGGDHEEVWPCAHVGVTKRGHEFDIELCPDGPTVHLSSPDEVLYLMNDRGDTIARYQAGTPPPKREARAVQRRAP